MAGAAVAAVLAVLASAFWTGSSLSEVPAALPASSTAPASSVPSASGAGPSLSAVAPGGVGAPRGDGFDPGRVQSTYPLDYAPSGAATPGAVTPDAMATAANRKSRPLPSASVAGGGQVAFPTSAPGRPAPVSPGVVSAGGGGPVSAGLVGQLIRQYFPAAQWGNANAVSMCESHQSNEVSKPNDDGSVDMGIFQLNTGGTLQRLLTEFGYPVSDVNQALDARWNVQAAALLYSQRGWEPWVCAATLGIWHP